MSLRSSPVKTAGRAAEVSLLFFLVVYQSRHYARMASFIKRFDSSRVCYAKSDKISKVQLFNSNPRIHDQDGFLPFECVKIVEFNFNSHVFHVIIRRLLHVSRDTFSQSRCMFFKSRRETTIFDQFCF